MLEGSIEALIVYFKVGYEVTALRWSGCTRTAENNFLNQIIAYYAMCFEKADGKVRNISDCSDSLRFDMKIGDKLLVRQTVFGLMLKYC